MSFKDSKVVIVGAGNVGATTAYSILNQGICEEVVLIDVNKEKAVAEAMDMQHSIYFMNRNMSIKAGDYSDCRDADVVVITASAPMPKDSTNRLEMLAPSMKIIKDIVENIMANGFDGVFVVISNPVDIMAYYVWKLSHLPKNRIIGSGTTLDTARLCCELSKMYNLDAKSVEAFVMAEHGDSEMVSWTSATIGGKNLSDVFADNADRTKDITRDELLKRTKQAGWDIFSRKGNTCYGIASSATAIIKSILFNENRILPVSVGLNGEYGLNDIFISVPTIINKNGAKEIVEIKLADDEQQLLLKSAELVQGVYRELQI
ncbi:L-lactate dehydrogenase [uncultured Treponema sp.]|uniref:L-lactate dehydrogenase n=1 Tax=uncultured Treponema sp. TaxID=162155 RepID=UPI0025F3D50B|nr:L-lactate dehydrogenase [uncultured Treponema sp.]